MKKLICTLSLLTVCGFAAKAQTQDPKAKSGVGAQTLTPIPASEEPKARMAITQKGVPASKAKNNETHDAKVSEQKAQPTEKH